MHSPGDRQTIIRFAELLEEGRAHLQLGDNTNLFDWTYVGNVVHAHLLAADKLVPPPPEDEENEKARRRQILDYPLPPADRTIDRIRVPTSSARPLGPCVSPPEGADALLAAFNSTDYVSLRPVVRSRFDSFSETTLAIAPSNPLQVAGQAFYITNGEPIYYWDFPRAYWRILYPEKYPSRKNTVLPKPMVNMLATLSEFWGWITGRDITFTRYRVLLTYTNRYYNIEKARRVLGYEPQVGLEEGLRRSAEVGTHFAGVELRLMCSNQWAKAERAKTNTAH